MTSNQYGLLVDNECPSYIELDEDSLKIVKRKYYELDEKLFKELKGEKDVETKNR